MKAILLVPGFAGSHLYRGTLGQRHLEKIWLSQVDIAWSGIADLDTAFDVSPPLLSYVHPTGVIEEVYQPFFTYFAGLQVPVWRFAYDWRTDVATNGQRLAIFISGFLPDDFAVTVVGHSMGGLVAASALNRLSPANALKVERFVSCGTPWRGSFRAVELFTGQHEITQNVVDLNKILSRRSRREWLLEAVRIVASWPGAYDLLPMPELLDEYLPGPGADFRVDPFFGKVNPWFTPLRYVQAVARRPIHTGFPPHIQHHNFRGVGRRTAGPMPLVFDGRPDFYFTALWGDGATPESSGWSPQAFASVHHNFNADHEQFLNNADVLRTLARLLGVLD